LRKFGIRTEDDAVVVQNRLTVFVRDGRKPVRFDPVGVRQLPDEQVTPWPLVQLVRAVHVPQRGWALALVANDQVRVLQGTLSGRRRRIKAIRDALTEYRVRYPRLFDFEMLDGPLPTVPSREFILRYSVAGTASVAAGAPPPPVTRLRSRMLMAVLGVVLVARVGLFVLSERHHEHSSPPQSTFPASAFIGTTPMLMCSRFQPSSAWDRAWPVESGEILVDGAVIWRMTPPPSGPQRWNSMGALDRFPRIGQYEEQQIGGVAIGDDAVITATIHGAGHTDAGPCR
jgi:hypothetical protein